MKRADGGFKICGITLLVLVVTGMVHRFVYFAFVMAKTGRLYRYDWEIWKQYFAWWPGKILCFTLAVLGIALILEAVYFIFGGRNRSR